MPSSSRKRNKGQARKARAKAAAAAVTGTPTTARLMTIDGGSGNVIENKRLISSKCNHTIQYQVIDICEKFITEFFQTYVSNISKQWNAVLATRVALDIALNKSMIANNKMHMSMAKKTLISNGVNALLGCGIKNTAIAQGCAAALMLIDSYDPSSPIPHGNFDQREPKKLLRNMDVLNGCLHSLVKFFVNQIPCKCLDELYTLVRSTTPKKGSCRRCQQIKARSSLYICTGCERIQYCSKACQLADVPDHKDFCKQLQSGNFFYG